MENESAVHGALLLYHAKRLRILGMNGAVQEVLIGLLRRGKRRSEDLLNVIGCERVFAYTQLVKRK